MPIIAPRTSVVEIPQQTDVASDGASQLVRAKQWDNYNGPGYRSTPSKPLPGWQTWGGGGVVRNQQ